jgi:hypothetical protein
VSGLIGAACILQFTYTFPPILELTFNIQIDSMLPEEAFDPATGVLPSRDSGLKRWLRGAKKQWYYKLWLLAFSVGSVATAVLGIFSSIVSIIAGFTGVHAISGFGCASPLGG